MVRIVNGLLVSAGAAALIQTYGVPAQAAASAAESERGGALEEIIVTARKRSESAQTTPVAVSAISAEALESAHLTRIDDLSAVVPNLTITPSGTAIGVTNTTIRGIVNADYQLMNDSPVGIYVDGVVIARATGALMSIVDLERVEVLRGPQGTLFGRNTTGGAITLFTKSPAEDFRIQQKLAYGTHNDFTSRTTVDTGKFGPLAAKVAYAHRQYDGWQRNLQTDKSEGVGAVDSDSFFFALHGDLTDRFTMDYKFDFDTEENRTGYDQLTGASPAVLAFFADSAALGGAPLLVSTERQDGAINQLDLGPSKLRVSGHNLTLNYAVNDAINLKSITAYRRVNTTFATSIGPGPLAAASNPAIKALITNREFDRQNQWSQEFQIAGQAGRFNYVSGLYWFDERVGVDTDYANSHTAVLLPPPLPAIWIWSQTANQYSGEAESYAAYSNVSYTPPILDDKLELTVGLRYTEDEKKLHQTLFTAGTTTVLTTRDLAKKFYNFSQSFSARYQWTPDFMTYYRWAKGYKAGGFNPRTSSPTQGNPPFDSENATANEIGFKSEFWDQRVRLNVAAFFTKYDDLQVSVLQPAVSGSGLQTVTDNAGKAEYKGGEIELIVLPADGWQISGAAGYVDPQYKEYITDKTTTPPTDISSRARFGSSSKVTSSLRVQYTFPHFAFGDLSVAPSWSYMSKRNFGTDPVISPRLDLIQAPSFSNVGAQITLADIPVTSIGSLTAQLYGKNLLNKYQRLTGLDITINAPRDERFGTDAYGPGREYGISLTGTF
jgi:iron complex outermembrane receptor protein